MGYTRGVVAVSFMLTLVLLGVLIASAFTPWYDVTMDSGALNVQANIRCVVHVCHAVSVHPIAYAPDGTHISTKWKG